MAWMFVGPCHSPADRSFRTRVIALPVRHLTRDVVEWRKEDEQRPIQFRGYDELPGTGT